MKKYYLLIILAIIVPITLRFFDANFLDQRLVNYVSFLTVWGLISLAVILGPYKEGPFNLPVKLIFFSILFSIVMANYSWDQKYWDSLIEYTQYLIWPLFFVLIGVNMPIKTIEKVVVAYGLVYVGLYLFQYINSGTVFFGKPLWGEEFLESRGTVRIIFPAKGVFLLSIFIAITKITSEESKNKWFWVIIAALGLVIPIMQVTRQYIAGVLLIYVLHFSKATSNIKKALFLLIFSLGFMVLIQSEIPMVKGLMDTQKESDTRVDENYIRVLAGKYFITDLSPNFWSQVFGNGSPYWGMSTYGKFIENLADRKGYFLSDLGLIAVYAMFGIFAVAGYILIWIKSLTVPIPPKYHYAKYYLWYLLITSFTGASLYFYHYLIATVFALYIFQKSYWMESKKRKIINLIKILETDKPKELK
ncbi:hypothetical protein [Cecembia lonarensis]|uniref:Lipid A core-O-antigen ligase n=1 Tax=Cecembia lonarensis (strain CCUG 58316 / KCTC 22772 / LW9) TaxID=1225176 RepID=K1LLQ4_CECL9|nr:hypothetical protein [Cecembia lonarensis]EKB51323.1 hypothetical protein B879_00117 [Cecembia lonarensis LW9]